MRLLRRNPVHPQGVSHSQGRPAWIGIERHQLRVLRRKAQDEGGLPVILGHGLELFEHRGNV